MSDAPAHLDGNAIGGLLAEVFGADLTAAPGVCGGCGRRGVVAELRVYLRAPGVVARCPGCDRALIRIVSVRSVACVDLEGLAELDVRGAPPTAV